MICTFQSDFIECLRKSKLLKSWRFKMKMWKLGINSWKQNLTIRLINGKRTLIIHERFRAKLVSMNLVIERKMKLRWGKGLRDQNRDWLIFSEIVCRRKKRTKLRRIFETGVSIKTIIRCLILTKVFSTNEHPHDFQTTVEEWSHNADPFPNTKKIF